MQRHEPPRAVLARTLLGEMRRVELGRELEDARFVARHLRQVTASVTYGYSLCGMGPPPLSRQVTASVAWGHRLCHVGLQPLLHRVAASVASGCSLRCIG